MSILRSIFAMYFLLTINGYAKLYLIKANKDLDQTFGSGCEEPKKVILDNIRNMMRIGPKKYKGYEITAGLTNAKFKMKVQRNKTIKVSKVTPPKGQKLYWNLYPFKSHEFTFEKLKVDLNEQAFLEAIMESHPCKKERVGKTNENLNQSLVQNLCRDHSEKSFGNISITSLCRRNKHKGRITDLKTDKDYANLRLFKTSILYTEQFMLDCEDPNNKLTDKLPNNKLTYKLLDSLDNQVLFETTIDMKDKEDNDIIEEIEKNFTAAKCQ